MNQIFVNLKRFEVSRRLGGLCPVEDPVAWIESVIDQAARLGLGAFADTSLVLMVPEGLVATSARRLMSIPTGQREHLSIGCQGVHWEDIVPGKNFGAFTTSQPATAVRHLGATWAIIGHSEERKAHQQVMSAFEPGLAEGGTLQQKAARATDRLVNAETLAALKAGLNVLVCVGETASERGEGAFEDQMPRIESVLAAQVEAALDGVKEMIAGNQLVMGYEPVWAIGPGKVPPGKEYIAYVSSLIKKTAEQRFTLDIPVVYGGGLKEENAAMIASIPTIGGGLVGLTRFTGEIGFNVDELATIMDQYRQARAHNDYKNLDEPPRSNHHQDVR